ncbi:MAG TPA: mercuric reductase [Dongiaceae bacterium]|nr:mercuric reductase [Dongiaceae bacterium]
MSTESPSHYDCLVIGSGQAANPLSQALANAGLRTALIEREHVGGTCVNEGCTPTKTMVASARVAHLARRGADYGVLTGPIQIDLKKVRERKRNIVESFRTGGEKRVGNTKGLDLILGEAKFIGPKVLRVKKRDGGEVELSGDKIFINAGCRPTLPELDGLAAIPYLTSTSIMELDAVPEHLIILGGGYVGLEFGQMFRRFGSRVSIVQSGEQLLGREDVDVAEAVLQILREDGIDVLLNAKATGVAESATGIDLTVEQSGKTVKLSGSHLLLATGRSPNADSVDAAAAGLQLDKHGYIRVNDKLETNVPGVYALGDINGGPAFTHISYDDFRIIRSNLLEGGNASIANRLVPYTVFIDPQLGRVGLTEAEARASGRKIRVAKMPMSWVARALETDETRGLMKVIVDAESKQILGAAILGIEGGEVMTQVQLAMMGKLPYTVLKDAVLAHPLLAESLNNLFAYFEGE